MSLMTVNITDVDIVEGYTTSQIEGQLLLFKSKYTYK